MANETMEIGGDDPEKDEHASDTDIEDQPFNINDPAPVPEAEHEGENPDIEEQPFNINGPADSEGEG